MDWNAGVGSQEIPGVTGKFDLGVQNEAQQRLRVLPREHTGHSKHLLPTAQEKTLHMDITRLIKYNQIDYILCSQRWRSSTQSAKIRQGADNGSYHELIVKLRLKLKKVGKPYSFRYDLNQIPYDYTVEVTNKFKGLDLIDRVPDELWNEVHDIVQEAVIKTIPPTRNVEWRNGCLRKPYK